MMKTKLVAKAGRFWNPRIKDYQRALAIRFASPRLFIDTRWSFGVPRIIVIAARNATEGGSKIVEIGRGGSLTNLRLYE